MVIKSTTTRGAGRGKTLGFPTINMVVTPDVPLSLSPGIYASRVFVEGQKYSGALYFGPASTFGENKNQLEVYIIDEVMIYVSEGEPIEVEVVKFIRAPEAFTSPELLVLKMEEDVEKIRKALNI